MKHSYSIILPLIEDPESLFASTNYSMDSSRNFCSQLFALHVVHVSTSRSVACVLGKSLIEYGTYPISIRTTLIDSDMQDEKLPESVKNIMDEVKRESDP